MNTKQALTLPGLILFALTACSEDHTDNILSSEDLPKNNASSFDSTGSTFTDKGEINFNLWNGIKTEYIVNTGHDNGSATSGRWFTFGDGKDYGSSSILFETWADKNSDSYMSSVINSCYGICGSVLLDNGVADFPAYAGLAFNVAGVDKDNIPQAADLTDWGGICVAYSTDMDIVIEMSLDNTTNQSINGDVPKATLSRTLDDNEKCFAWKEFKQSGNQTLSGETAAKQATAFRFTFYGKSGSMGKFNIRALGTYNTPHQPPQKDTYSSSSQQKDDSLIWKNENNIDTSKFDMWNPNRSEYTLYTGLDNGTETSGYWYSFDDNFDGGLSRISWPNEGLCCEDDNMDHIIDAYGGVSGTAILGKGSLKTAPFAGIGFNVAGILNENSDKAQPADASSWGGICFAYKSEIDFRVEMGIAGHPDEQSMQDLPGKNVQASSEVAEVCIPWSEFKQKEGNEMDGEQVAKQLASIRFTFYGKDGDTGTFNIMGIGTKNNVVERREF